MTAMGEANTEAARRREWTRIAHDAMHEFDALDSYGFDDDDMGRIGSELLSRVHDALHHAVGDEPPPAETAATDLRPFDKAFAALAREHGVAAVWVAALDGKLHSGGHVELAGSVLQLLQAGMQALAAAPPEPQVPDGKPALWTPNGDGRGLIVPEGGT